MFYSPKRTKILGKKVKKNLLSCAYSIYLLCGVQCTGQKSKSEKQQMYTLFILSILPISAFGLRLTSENWFKETYSKIVFVRFFASWSKHCEAMKPVWETLTGQYEDSQSIIIAEVDCTGDGMEICEFANVDSFPSFKYGYHANLLAYVGNRDLSSLQDFVVDMETKCNGDNLGKCDDEQKGVIEDLSTKSIEELDDMLADIDAKNTAVRQMIRDKWIETQRLVINSKSKQREIKQLFDRIEAEQEKKKIAINKDNHVELVVHAIASRK